MQDAKARQLKELQCEAAVLEVYTGLYKMTELMQDARAEVYVGTIGELASSCPASRDCLAAVIAHDRSKPPSGGLPHGTLLPQDIWLGWLGGPSCILQQLFSRAEGLPPAGNTLQHLPCVPGGPAPRCSQACGTLPATSCMQQSCLAALRLAALSGMASWGCSSR